MQAGRLRHRITVQTAVTSRNTRGEEIVDRWDDTFNAWAEIDPPKGREYFSANQKQASVAVRVCIRYREGVVPKQRIKFGKRILEISAVVNPEERNRELILTCTEAA